jgi:restriction endonuclease S subunit
MIQRSNGGNYPAITQEELSNIEIPLPPLKIQEKIVVEIQKIREQAQTLQNEAKAVVEQAKIKVEKMILEGGNDDWDKEEAELYMPTDEEVKEQLKKLFDSEKMVLECLEPYREQIEGLGWEF